MQNLSKALNANTSATSAKEGSLSSNSSHIFNLHRDYWKNMEELEGQADTQSKENDLNDCAEFVSQLVDLFKHTVIIPELQCVHEWHKDHEHQLTRNKGTTGNSFLDERVQKIAISKGLTKEQWKALLYLNLTASDSLEMINVSKNHLKKVHDMVSRLLESEEQATVFALIDAIEKNMPTSHYTEK